MRHAWLRRWWGAVLALPIVAAPAAAQQEWRWSGAVDRGDAIEIRGINGEITATATSGTAEVVARKHGKKSDPATVRIEVIEDSQGVLICAVYPDQEDEDPNRCGRDDDYEMRVGKNDVAVDFTVRVPAGVDLGAMTVNGDVRATGLSGRVEAVTVNGSIELTTSGYATATTVNGSIDARLGSADWDGPLSFTTVNGGITLALPANTAADVTAHTVNGAIESDFELTVQGRFMVGMRKLEGQIGGGGAPLHLNTVNGTIAIRKS